MTSNEKMIWAAAFAAGYWNGTYNASELANHASLVLYMFRCAEKELRDSRHSEDIETLDVLKEFCAE